MTTTHPPRHRRNYRQLLRQRVNVGRCLVDQLSHARDAGSGSRQMERLHQRVQLLDRLDAELSQHARWACDAPSVLRAERQRHHEPGLPPADHERPPCVYCRHLPHGIASAAMASELPRRSA